MADNGWRLERGARVWVAGSRGLVGSALAERLRLDGADVVDAPRSELDLRDPDAALAFAEEARPEALVLAAAVVGGIADNLARPAVYARDNLLIHVNAIHAAAAAGAKCLCVVGSSCMYPRDCPQPMRESMLWSGILEPTNSAYAAAKLAATETALAYGRQHGIAVVVPVAPNLFGERDRFDRQRCHFLPGMVGAFCDAADSQSDHVVLWGTGKPRREAMHARVYADGIARLLRACPDAGVVNLGTTSDRTIKDWARLVAKACGFKGRIEWDEAKPDGMPRKMLDSARAWDLIAWEPEDDLELGLRRLAQAYREGKREGTLR